MVELSPQAVGCMCTKQALMWPVAKKAPSGAACFLLNCFFLNSELIGSNLTGANGKKQLSPQIIDAIVCK